MIPIFAFFSAIKLILSDSEHAAIACARLPHESPDLETPLLASDFINST